MTVALKLDDVNDEMIDSSSSYVTLRDGDGYYLTDFQFEEGTLSGEWTDGKIFIL
ncbi:MAG: hypothetical protein ACLU9T_07135 [Blautia faecis]